MRTNTTLLALLFLAIPFFVIRAQKAPMTPDASLVPDNAAASQRVVGQSENSYANPIVQELAEFRIALDANCEQDDQAFQDKLAELFGNEPKSVLESSQKVDMSRLAAGFDQILAQQLWKTGVLLVEKANQLEVERNYDNADALRRLAKRLRKQAREFDNPISSKDE